MTPSQIQCGIVGHEWNDSMVRCGRCRLTYAEYAQQQVGTAPLDLSFDVPRDVFQRHLSLALGGKS